MIKFGLYLNIIEIFVEVKIELIFYKIYQFKSYIFKPYFFYFKYIIKYIVLKISIYNINKNISLIN